MTNKNLAREESELRTRTINSQKKKERKKSKLIERCGSLVRSEFKDEPRNLLLASATNPHGFQKISL